MADTSKDKEQEYQAICRAKHREKKRLYMQEWKRNNPERVRAYFKKHYTKNAEKRRASAREWYHNNRDRACRVEQARKVGVTPEVLAEMEKAQQNKCAICAKAETKKDHRRGTPCRLSVDHDHTNGQIRGLLCDRCNRAIGLLGDDVERLRRAATYIERWCR